MYREHIILYSHYLGHAVSLVSYLGKLPLYPIALAPFKTTGEVDRESFPKHMKYFQATLIVVNSLPGGNDICHTN